MRPLDRRPTNRIPRNIRRRIIKDASGMTDLFALFPELPRIPRPPIVEQQQRVLRNVERMQENARRNVDQQRLAAANVKAKWTANRSRTERPGPQRP
jgi:hypothetical protein